MLKTLIIGLDGATFDLIDPWIKKGDMPNLSKLISEGAWGELQTVFPPITPAAWSSFLTGKNPGKHGIYDFLHYDMQRHEPEPNNRLTRRATDFWEIFNRNGLSTGLISIPTTYPPAEVNGYMITGLMTPRKEPVEKTDYTYPAGLKYEIKENVGKYVIHPKVPYKKGKAKKVYDDLINSLEIKVKTVRYLMTKHPTNLTMFVIAGTDKILHDMYHLIDPNHPSHDTEEAKKDAHFILDYYKNVDLRIGEIIDEFCDENTLIAVISDHGNGPIYKWIYLNNWLLKEGYLKLKKTPLTLIKRFLFNLGLTPSNIYKFLLKFGFSKSKVSFKAREKIIAKFFLSWDDIDWKRTRAFSFGHVGQIFIHKQNKETQEGVTCQEYENLKSEIEEKLEKLQDTDGTMVVEKILDKSKVYSGPYESESADIIFMPHRLEYMALGTSAFASNKIIGPAFGNSGNHRMNGIFIIKGRGIKKNYNIKNTQITDVIPNILFWNDLPIDADMDGKILKDIYEEEFLASHQAMFKEKSTETPAENTETVYSQEDVDSIRKALEDLGYLS